MMNRIKELRKQKNLTLRQLSESLKEKGLSLSTDSISKYERGVRNPKIENWVKLSKFFDVSVAYLKGEKQKSCPYCHSEKAIIQISDELQVYISNGLNNQSLALVYDFSDEAITDEEYVIAPFGRQLNSKIKFCPMCGRNLRSDDKFRQTYREEESDGESIDTGFTSGD